MSSKQTRSASQTHSQRATRRHHPASASGAARERRRQREQASDAQRREQPANAVNDAASQGASAQRLAWSLLWVALTVEAFLLGLLVAAPLGGVTFTISPLARQWPWLLAPARLLFGDAPVSASIAPEQGWAQLALFAVLLVGATCAATLAPLIALRDGGHAVRLALSDRRLLALALGAALVLGVTLVLLPALPSDDLFSYILYGRISVIHHANPLIATPSDFPNDPFLHLVFWRDTRSVYGPVWLLLSGGLALLADVFGGSLFTYTLLFKLLGLAAHLLNAWLIWLILGRLSGATPARRLAGTLFYAWNPLCVLEFCASAHNDAVMLTLLLLGIYLLLRDHEVWALVAFAASISTKYVPLALLPFYFVYVARRLAAQNVGWRRIGLALAWRVGLLALTLIALTAPYWSGPQTVESLLYSPPAQQLNNSLLEAIQWPLRWLAQGAFGMGAAAARALVDTTLKALALLLFGLLWLYEFRRTRTLTGTVQAWGWALVWYALVASGWFWPWYVTWALAVVALLPWSRLSVATALLAGGSLTLYAFLPLHSSPVYGYRSIIAFGPALAYLLWQVWRSRTELRAEFAGLLQSLRAWMVHRLPFAHESPL
ncbi:MAG: hypothetical protein ABI068_15560 [Ktedonobacterales bacterium]